MQNGTGSHDAKTDIFEKSSLISGEEGIVKDVNEIDSPTDIPEGFDELPIELISLTDRCVIRIPFKSLVLIAALGLSNPWALKSTILRHL